MSLTLSSRPDEVSYEQSNVEITPIMSYLADGLNALLSKAGMKRTTSEEFSNGVVALAFDKSLLRPLGIDEFMRSLRVIFDANNEKVVKYFNHVQIERGAFFTDVLPRSYKKALMEYRVIQNTKVARSRSSDDEDDDQVASLGIVNYISRYLDAKLKDNQNIAIEIAKLLDDGATLDLGRQFVLAMLHYIESKAAQRISDMEEHEANVKLESFLQKIVTDIMQLIEQMLRAADPQEAESLSSAVLISGLSSLDAQCKLPPAIALLAKTLSLQYNPVVTDASLSNVVKVNFQGTVASVNLDVRQPLIDIFAPFGETSVEPFRSESPQRENLKLRWKMRGLPSRVAPSHKKAGSSQQQLRKKMRRPTYKTGPDGSQTGSPFGTYPLTNIGKHSVKIKK